MGLNKLYIFILLILSSSIFAQSADLELEVYMESYNDVFFGFEGAFTVTVTNNGPDVAENPGTASPLMSLTNNDFTFIGDGSISQDRCFFSLISAEPRPPDFDGGLTLLITTDEILVGESVTCFGRFSIGFEHGSREVYWQTFGFGMGALVDDPVPENNIVTITLGIQPQQVDALSNLTILILIVITLGVGLRFRV